MAKGYLNALKFNTSVIVFTHCRCIYFLKDKEIKSNSI